MVATAPPGATVAPRSTGMAVIVPAQGATSTSVPFGPLTRAISWCDCTVSPSRTLRLLTLPPLTLPILAWATGRITPRERKVGPGVGVGAGGGGAPAVWRQMATPSRSSRMRAAIPASSCQRGRRRPRAGAARARSGQAPAGPAQW